MIQVLERAFSLLELLAESPESPRSMGELANHIGVSSATCSHIVKTMLVQGYLEKAEPRGYVLGPMAYYLAHKGPYRKELISAAQPLLAAFAASTEETALVAVLRNEKRFILCQAQGTHRLQVNTDAYCLDDAYHTATGHLLLAGLSEKELDAFLGRMGLPEPKTWPEAHSPASLREELKKIRDAGTVSRPSQNTIMQIAYPVMENGKIAAAVGSFVPLYRYSGEHQQRVLQSLQQIANQLTEHLAHFPKHVKTS